MKLKTDKVLRDALHVIDAEITKMHTMRESISGMLGYPAKTLNGTATGRKPMSAAARRRIAKAQRARWAKQKKAA